MNEAIAKEIECRLAWHQKYVSRGFIKPHQAVAEELASLLDWCRNTPALSSPCGDRKPLGTIGALVRIGQPHPQKFQAYANLYTSQIRLFPIESVKDGQWVDVLVFARLPANEPQGE